MDISVFWLLVGCGLILVEVFTAPGIGLFLAGFGAISTAFVVQLGLTSPDAHAAQFAWFFGCTSLWALLLWKPLQKFRVRQRSTTHAGPERHDIVGSSAVVGKNGIKRHETGQVKWSGTLMNAVLDAHNMDDFLPEGTPVRITAVSGTTLSVITVQP